MNSYVQEGSRINYLNSGETVIKRGDVVVLPSRIAIAETDIPAGEEGVLALTGVFEMDSGAVAIAVGDAVYWDIAAGNIKISATGNTPAGMAISAKGAVAGRVLVRIG